MWFHYTYLNSLGRHLFKIYNNDKMHSIIYYVRYNLLQDSQKQLKEYTFFSFQKYVGLLNRVPYLNHKPFSASLSDTEN